MEVLPKIMHRNKLWKHMIDSLAHDSNKKKNKSSSLSDVPFKEWCIARKATEVILSEFELFTTKIVERQDSKRGDTTKLLIELQDGHRVETVVMRHMNHNTVCISSQIGCQMGCR